MIVLLNDRFFIYFFLLCIFLFSILFFIDIEEGLRKAYEIAGDGTAEEKKQRLIQTPISIVLEGEAFAQLYPDKTTKINFKNLRKSIVNDLDNTAELLIAQSQFFELASMAKSVVCCRLTPAQKAKIVTEMMKKGHCTLAIGDGKYKYFSNLYCICFLFCLLLNFFFVC
jgi:hypothetical protein